LTQWLVRRLILTPHLSERLRRRGHDWQRLLLNYKQAIPSLVGKELVGLCCHVGHVNPDTGHQLQLDLLEWRQGWRHLGLVVFHVGLEVARVHLVGLVDLDQLLVLAHQLVLAQILRAVDGVHEGIILSGRAGRVQHRLRQIRVVFEFGLAQAVGCDRLAHCHAFKKW